MKTLVVDYETKWNSKDYTLSKMSGIEYIRDPRFKAFGLCYKELNDPKPATWVSHAGIPAWVASVDWSDTAVVAHNFGFDGSILAWRYGAVPAAIFDTLSMARALRGVDAGGSLAKLAEHYKLPPKGRAVHSTDGLEELTPAIEQELAEYCQHDVYLCEQIFLRFMAEGFPKKELKLIDMTLRMLVQPVLELDKDVLIAHLHDVRHRKANLLIEAGVDPGELSSNPKFAALLARYGVACPTKISPTTGKETWALAKTDEGLKVLAEHPNLTIQALVAARLGTKSTLEETRTETFLRIAEGKVMPVPLKYWGARTGRWSGEVYNLQNVPRGSELKEAIKAPEGHVIVGVDLSNIELRVGLWFAGQHDKLDLLAQGKDLYKDFASSVFNVPYESVTKDQRFIGKTCIAEGQLVLTDQGLIPIEKVPLDSLVWDGVEFVSHDGPIYQGEKDVILYDGLEATPDHEVFLSDGSTCQFGVAADKAYSLAITGDARGVIRLGEDRVPGSSAPRETPTCTGGVLELRQTRLASDDQSGAGDRGVQTLLASPEGAQTARSDTNSSEGPLRKSKRSWVSELWCAWHSIRVRFGARSGPLDTGESTPMGGRHANRQGGQQSGVCAGESPLGDTRTKHSESEVQYYAGVPSSKGPASRGAVRGCHTEEAMRETDCGGDSGTVGRTFMQTKRRVWDLLNAGPRRRFTVAGKLVHNCQLALIYGTGANKLRSAIKTGSGVDIGEDEAKRIVALYRQEYSAVAMAWRLGEQVLRTLALGESMEYGTRGVVQVTPKGCRLPSGMFMQYPGLERVVGDDGKANWVYYTRKGREKLYGAKMFQGLTQALARCIMGDGMLLTAKRYPIALTVHDAEYFVAPETEGAEALQFAIDSVCTPPKWALELPLAAEGAFGKTLADC